MRIVICALKYRRARDQKVGESFHVLLIDGIAAYRAASRREIVDMLTALDAVAVAA